MIRTVQRVFARQVQRVLREQGLLASSEWIGQHRFVTSGEAAAYRRIVSVLVAREIEPQAMVWDEDQRVRWAAGDDDVKRGAWSQRG